MTAVNACVIGQASQLQQRLPHHLRRALDDAATADGEQRVADEGELLGCKEIADMAGGMSGRLVNLACERADGDLVPLAYGRIDERDLRCLAVGRNHAAAMTRLELGNPARVVRMMMRDQDIGQSPAGSRKGSFDGRRLGRIDRGRRSSGVIVQEDAVIVLAGRGRDGSERAWAEIPISGVRKCVAPDMIWYTPGSFVPPRHHPLFSFGGARTQVGCKSRLGPVFQRSHTPSVRGEVRRVETFAAPGMTNSWAGPAMLGLRHVDRCRRSAQFLRHAAWGRRATFGRPRHSPALCRHARDARARNRLCNPLSRSVSGGSRALLGLHAGGARGIEMADRPARAGRSC